MELSKIAMNNIETPQSVVNMKNRIQEEKPQTTEENPKEALTNPMETVGRSQVQFRGALSAKDLNFIAEPVTKINLNGSDIKTLKQALTHTMETYKFKSIEEVNRKLADDLDGTLDFTVDVINEAARINPKSDLNKIGLVVNTIF